LKRKIIEIDESKCDGCGKCIPSCPEGAIQIINGKAKLVSDVYCDGLGACLGSCPKGAIKIIEREAEEYDERKVIENIVKKGPEAVASHLKHLQEHGETENLKIALEYLRSRKPCHVSKNWPIKLSLVPVSKDFFDKEELVVAADCTAFVSDSVKKSSMEGKLIIGCPKLGNKDEYLAKLTEIFKTCDIKRVKVFHMEVPCCHALFDLVKEAAEDSKVLIERTIIPVG